MRERYQLYSSEMDEKVRREQEVQKHKEWRQSLKAKYTLGSFEEAIFNKFDKVCMFGFILCVDRDSGWIRLLQRPCAAGHLLFHPPP